MKPLLPLPMRLTPVASLCHLRAATSALPALPWMGVWLCALALCTLPVARAADAPAAKAADAWMRRNREKYKGSEIHWFTGKVEEFGKPTSREGGASTSTP